MGFVKYVIRRIGYSIRELVTFILLMVFLPIWGPVAAIVILLDEMHNDYLLEEKRREHRDGD